MRCRVIDDLAHYRRKIVEGVAFTRKDLRGGHVPNFTKLGKDIRPSSLLTEFISELRYLAAFSNAGRSKMSDVQ